MKLDKIAGKIGGFLAQINITKNSIQKTIDVFDGEISAFNEFLNKYQLGEIDIYNLGVDYKKEVSAMIKSFKEANDYLEKTQKVNNKISEQTLKINLDLAKFKEKEGVGLRTDLFNEIELQCKKLSENNSAIEKLLVSFFEKFTKCNNVFSVFIKEYNKIDLETETDKLTTSAQKTTNILLKKLAKVKENLSLLADSQMDIDKLTALERPYKGILNQLATFTSAEKITALKDLALNDEVNLSELENLEGVDLSSVFDSTK